MDFTQYYQKLGFKTYPFSIYNSEGEGEKSKEIYKQPDNYTLIKDGLDNSSVIITGERGTGKTALNLDICRTINNATTLIVQIDEFSSLTENYNEEDLYKFLQEKIAIEFFTKMAATPLLLWKYNKEDRVDLSMFLHKYIPVSSKALLTEKIKDIQNTLLKRAYIWLFNALRVLLNYGLKALTKIISDALTKHFSALPEIDLSNSDYFRRLESEVDESFQSTDKNYHLLGKLCILIKKSKFKKIIIALDKIDEDPRFRNDAEPISEFIEKIASNNKIMVHANFKILLFSWTTPFNFIKSNVRTQKLTLQPLEWTKATLESAANKRVMAFSDNKITKITDIFEEESKSEIDSLYAMSNENPRDLWHILDKCIKAQFNLNSSMKITKEAIKSGIENFVTTFNYYEYYPKKSNAKSNSMDVYSYIKHLLKLDSAKFTKDKLNTSAQIGSSTNNYVVSMENMGLIKKTNEKSPGGGVIYQIRDPKVIYALEHKIDIENK